MKVQSREKGGRYRVGKRREKRGRYTGKRGKGKGIDGQIKERRMAG